MLQYIKDVETATFGVTIIRGRDISRARLSKRQRAELAIEVIEGRTVIIELTKRQVAHVCGVPAGYLRALRNASGRHPTRLVEALLQANPAERVEAARALGLKWMFRNMINPSAPSSQNGAGLNNVYDDDVPF